MAQRNTRRKVRNNRLNDSSESDHDVLGEVQPQSDSQRSNSKVKGGKSKMPSDDDSDVDSEPGNKAGPSSSAVATGSKPKSQYRVTAVTNKCLMNGATFYHVHWANGKAASWEHSRVVVGKYDDLIDDYELLHAGDVVLDADEFIRKQKERPKDTSSDDLSPPSKKGASDKNIKKRVKSKAVWNHSNGHCNGVPKKSAFNARTSCSLSAKSEPKRKTSKKLNDKQRKNRSPSPLTDEDDSGTSDDDSDPDSDLDVVTGLHTIPYCPQDGVEEDTDVKSVGSNSGSDLSDEDEYKVELIMGKRRVGANKKLQYWVKWLGYTENDNTWEPAGNMSCPDKIKRFENILAEKIDLKK